VKRKLAWMAVLVVFMLIALAWYCLLNDDRINQDTYDRIRLGMTIDEVQKTVGTKGSDQFDQQDDNGFRSRIVPTREMTDMQIEGDWVHKPDDNESGKRFGWGGLNGAVMIRVDQEGRVTDRMFIKLKPLGLLDQLRWIAAGIM